MKFTTATLLLASAALGAAQSGTASCDAACQEAFAEAVAIEASSWVNRNVTQETFYQTPANATGAAPGALLRWEDVPRSVINTSFTPPSGLSLSRFLYMTEDMDRSAIPASAFMLLPFNNPNPGKPLRTVVWTHGTAGRIRNCAPSNHKDLYYGWMGPYILARMGYAVIAPDYAGQGSDIPQGFMYEAGYLHAGDVAYALIAARKATGKLLSQEYVVMGHSEGGLTAWRVNERLAKPDQGELRKAGKFLGSIANAPALRPLDLIPKSVELAKGGPIGDAVSVFFIQSLAGLFPKDIRIEDILAPQALGRVALADKGCLLTGRTLFGGLTATQLFKNMDWLKNPVVVDWQKRYNGAGPHPLAAPMLVINGITDPLVYANNTEWDFDQTCAKYPESNVQLRLYPESDHNVNAMVPTMDFMKWIEDRFNGVPVKKGCSKHVVEPLTNNFRNAASWFWGSN